MTLRPRAYQEKAAAETSLRLGIGGGYVHPQRCVMTNYSANGPARASAKAKHYEDDLGFRVLCLHNPR